jgi:peptide-methionine (S)-S-oxide reductase
VVSGYAGGSASTADYESVCSGNTGHAEVVKIDYDPAKISYGRLLRVLFSVAHDPTQLNRQGNDRGTQYRSAVFYRSEPERDVVNAYIKQLDAAGVFKAPIVTQVTPLVEFYRAETYHQDYAARNPDQPYIAMVSTPKVEKLRKTYAPLLRK